MKKVLTIFIGFMHDFAAGLWAATVMVVFWVDRLAGDYPDLRSLLADLERHFFWAGIVCMAIVLLAGVGRTFTYSYIGDVYGEDSEPLRKKMLIIKHILLFTVFIGGTWWQYSMAFSQ